MKGEDLRRMKIQIRALGKPLKRRNRWRAERKNRKLSIRKYIRSRRKKAEDVWKKEEATGNRSGKPRRRMEPKGKIRERVSRGSHLQGRDGGRRKEIADEAACI